MNAKDHHIRLAAFQWLTEQVTIYGDVLPRSLLEKGFVYNNQQIKLVSPKGIHKPKQFTLPLTITTAPKGPYADKFSKDGMIQYKYRGSDPRHPDNVGLRKAMQTQTPLIYFFGISPGNYVASFPVYIVGDDPTNLTFTVAVDELNAIQTLPENTGDTWQVAESATEARRVYITATVRKRLHQRTFRERVLAAYRQQCSLCRLRHPELLDAAHIIPDSDPAGEPLVSNGLSLCKLHHAAYDNNLLGISPDYEIKVRQDILEEEDGPMLQHGLKGLHNGKIILPRSQGLQPDRALLEQRFQGFKAAG